MRAMRAQTVSVTTVTLSQRDTMFDLMSQYYDCMSRERFDQDLDAKDDVILLLDAESGDGKGFSTLKTIETEVDGQTIRALFRGDTVVDQAYWGQRVLGKEFLKYLFIQKAKHPFSDFYWMLISKGYKTYLLLANNFNEHYPRYEEETPPAYQRVLDKVSGELFGDCYDPQTGVIVFKESLGQLKEGIADVPCDVALENPRIQFFAERNPRWAEGVELACLAKMTWSMPFYYALKSWWKLIGRRWLSEAESRVQVPVVREKEA